MILAAATLDDVGVAARLRNPQDAKVLATALGPSTRVVPGVIEAGGDRAPPRRPG